MSTRNYLHSFWLDVLNIFSQQRTFSKNVQKMTNEHRKKAKNHRFWTSTCNLMHLTVLFDWKLPPSFSEVNNTATKALQKLVVAKTAEPVTLLKKLWSTGANKARIFFAMKSREQTGQTLLPRVLPNRKTQIEKCCLPCQVQPFLVAFRNSGSQTNTSSCSQIVLVYLQQFHRNSILKCAPQQKIAKINKNLLFWKFKVFQKHRCW